MSVLAIDFGNCNVVASVPKDRGIDIILSDTSKRQIPTVVSYGQEERFFADQANGQKLSNRNGCFYYLPLILGEKVDSPAINRARTMGARFQLKAGVDGRAIGSVRYGGDQKTIETQNMTAALIHRVHGFAKATQNVNPTDIIMSVPGNWDTNKRQLLRAAAASTGLHCLGIISQHIAVGAGYYMKRVQDFQKLADDNQGIKQAFLSIGECQSFFAVLQMSKKSVQTISAVYEAEFGSIDFDLCLKGLIEDQVKTKGRLSDDEIQSPKTQQKIMNAANSLKKSLCMNQTAQATIECVGDAGVDVGITVRLDEFNELIQKGGLLDRLNNLIQTGLANIAPTEIESIEVLGGASRIKALQEIVIKTFTAEKISKRLNPDEAVAYGLGWLGAMRSTKYHIPFKVQFNDLLRPLEGPIQLSFIDQAGNKVHDAYTMYETNGQCPKSKKLNLSFQPGKYNFILSEGNVIHQQIEVDIKPKDFTQFVDREAAERDGVNFNETTVKMHIKVEADADQYVRFTGISRQEHQLIYEDQRKEVPNDRYDAQVAEREQKIVQSNEEFARAAAEFEAKDRDYQAAKAAWDEQRRAFEADEANKDKKFEPPAPAAPARPAAPKTPDEVPKTVWITQKVPKIVLAKTDLKPAALQGVDNIEEETRRIKAFEAECAKIDAVKHQYAEAYNRLETLLYKAKDDVEAGLKDFLTPEDVQVVQNIAQEVAGFLDQIEGPQQIDQLKAKTDDVSTRLQPFYSRKQSHTDAEYQYSELKANAKQLLKRYGEKKSIPAIAELLNKLETQMNSWYDKLQGLNKLETVQDVFGVELKALSEMEGEMKKAAAEAGVKSENVTPKVGENSSEAPQSGADSAKPQV